MKDMEKKIPTPLLEAFSFGRITRKDIEEETGQIVRFGQLLDQLHAQSLPLPRFPANPEKAQIVADLLRGGPHVR